MSKQNDFMMVGLLLAGVYLYSRRNQVAYNGQQTIPRGAVGTMPASAGAGWQQIGASALVGFLANAAKSLTGNNGSTSYVPSLNNQQQLLTDYSQSGTVQDVAYPFNWEGGMSDYSDYSAYA